FLLLLHVLGKRFLAHVQQTTRISKAYVQWYHATTIAAFVLMFIAIGLAGSEVELAWRFVALFLPGTFYIVYYFHDLRGQRFLDLAAYILVVLCFGLAC